MHIIVLTTWGIWQYIFYMLSSEDILEFLHSALQRNKFISAVKNTRGLYLGNLTLTKIQSINSETPCVHVDRCSETYEWNRSINLIGHIWHPYFSEHTGIAECVRVSKNLQSNSQQQNYLLPELFWGMSGVDLKNHNHSRLWNIWKKWKVYRQDPILFRLNLLYLWEYLPLLS